LAAVTATLAAISLRELANVIAIPTDFGTYVRAAELLAQSEDPYAGTGGAYFYPPAFAFWARPLTWMPIAWASLTWFHAKLVMLVMLVRWTLDLVDGWSLPSHARGWFILGMLALSARFILADLQYGNANLVIAFLVVGSIHLELIRRSRLSGALVALAAMVKVVPGLFIAWWFARRRFAATGIALAALALLLLVPWAFEPSDAAMSWNRYWEDGVRGRLGDDLSRGTNQSLLGLALRMFPGQPGVARIVWVTVSGIWLGFGCAMAHRHRSSARLTQTTAAAFMAGCLVAVSPGSWVVHYTGTFLPLAVLLRLAYERSGPRLLYASVLVVMFLATTVSGWFRQTLRPALEGSWFLASLTLVMAALAYALLTRPTSLHGEASVSRSAAEG
jgi:alpha-1,2-mannosyltransferase